MSQNANPYTQPYVNPYTTKSKLSIPNGTAQYFIDRQGDGIYAELPFSYFETPFFDQNSVFTNSSTLGKDYLASNTDIIKFLTIQAQSLQSATNPYSCISFEYTSSPIYPITVYGNNLTNDIGGKTITNGQGNNTTTPTTTTITGTFSTDATKLKLAGVVNADGSFFGTLSDAGFTTGATAPTTDPLSGFLSNISLLDATGKYGGTLCANVTGYTTATTTAAPTQFTVEGLVSNDSYTGFTFNMRCLSNQTILSSQNNVNDFVAQSLNNFFLVPPLYKNSINGLKAVYTYTFE